MTALLSFLMSGAYRQINAVQLKDTARRVQYPASRVVRMGVTQQEPGKPPDTLGK